MSRQLRERAMTAVLWACALTVMAIFGWILWDIVANGYRALSFDYFTEPPSQAGREGGIASILVATLLLLGVALVASLPLGIGCAVYLAEFTRRDDPLGRAVRRSLDVLAGVPSIVFGLFGMAFFCEFLGWGWSIASGGLTLACMVVPIVVRTTEEGLRATPELHRQGCDALGISKATALMRVLLPSAVPGIMAGLVLGVGRALAETAAVMFTAGASIRMPDSLWDSGRSLAYHIYIMSIEVPGGTERAHTAALVLVLLLMGINLVSHVLVTRFLKGKLLVH